MLESEVGKGFLLLYETLTGEEPVGDERDEKKAELLQKVRNVLKGGLFSDMRSEHVKR